MGEPGRETRLQPVRQRHTESKPSAHKDQQIRPEIPVQGILDGIVQRPVEAHAQVEIEIQGNPSAPQQRALDKAVQVEDVLQAGWRIVPQCGKTVPSQTDPDIRKTEQRGIRTVILRRLVSHHHARRGINAGGHHLVPPGERRGHIGGSPVEGHIPLVSRRRRFLCMHSHAHQPGDQGRYRFHSPFHRLGKDTVILRNFAGYA